MKIKGQCFLIFGGAGLAGRQVARQIAKELQPRKIVIASLYEQEVTDALKDLEAEFGNQGMEWAGEWGNIFVRADLAFSSRSDLVNSRGHRQMLLDDLFGDINKAYEKSHMVQMILRHKPDVIIDSINTATALSYQDVYTASAIARREFTDLVESVLETNIESALTGWKGAGDAVEILMLTQALPQLTRHIMMLYRILTEVGTGMYLKIGTTGTGGMGLNIPYTHSEDKPSAKLLTKTAVAFAHTGLMFLMARTPDGPIVKELKPGAMIGYADVTPSVIREHGKAVSVYESQEEVLSGSLNLQQPVEEYQNLGDMELPVVNTGENGLFTRGEFEAITALDQMEFITPEEIARETVLEIRGSNTGQDVIAAINSSVINPTYRAGYLRQQVIVELDHLEATTGAHSVALGQLGPPELSKLLWESQLLKLVYGDIAAVLEDEPEAISRKVYDLVRTNEEVRRLIISIGVPILTPDGKKLLRGPRLRIPEIPGFTRVDINPEDVDKWATKGWVDLRAKNFAFWKGRFDTMLTSKNRIFGRGSAVVDRAAYLFNEIRIGEIVGWIFNNEMSGYRSGIK